MARYYRGDKVNFSGDKYTPTPVNGTYIWTEFIHNKKRYYVIEHPDGREKIDFIKYASAAQFNHKDLTAGRKYIAAAGKDLTFVMAGAISKKKLPKDILHASQVQQTKSGKFKLKKQTLKLIDGEPDLPEPDYSQPSQALDPKPKKFGKHANTMYAAGERQIGDQKIYARSMWEANIARYLQWRKEIGDIKGWAHEPKTFWYEKIKRGVRSYLPDFRVDELNGHSYYVEVKGFMDKKSTTKIKRFKKYFPNERLVVYDAAWYKINAPKLSKVIEGWEKPD